MTDKEKFKIPMQTYQHGPLDMEVDSRCEESYRRMEAKGHYFAVLFAGPESLFTVHPALTHSFKAPNGPGVQEIVEQFIIDNYPEEK